jgi:hypothetical protein
MRWFFDQWFFQSGFPEIVTEFAASGRTVTILLRQLQKQLPFRLNADVSIRGANGEMAREGVELTGRETQLKVTTPFAIRDVVFDPDNRLLVRRLQ